MGQNEAQNRRDADRRRSLLMGKIFDGKGRVWECTVHDFSVTGTKTKIPGLDPADFDFVKGQEVDLKIVTFNDMRRTEVMWIRPPHIGLRYLSPITNPTEAMRKFLKLIKHGETQLG
jgi:hypothetical protein